MPIKHLRICALCLVAIATGCGGATPTTRSESAAAAGPDGALRVVLFPYLPPYSANQPELARSVRTEFARAHGDVALDLVVDINADLYDLDPTDDGSPSYLERLLGTGPDGADVVEIDAVLLGDLVERGLVSPVALPYDDYFPSARAAVTRDGTVYGVPTWQCTHVVYSANPVIANITTVDELVRAIGTVPTRPVLVGNFAGSWTLPAMYLDAYADLPGTEDFVSVLAAETPEPSAVAGLRTALDLCGTGENACLNETYKDNDESQRVFVRGDANAWIGYTEGLHALMTLEGPQRPTHVVSAPLAAGSEPLMFTDVFVVNTRCRGACLERAAAFIRYYTDAATQAWIMRGDDLTDTEVYRYNLSARRSAYEGDGLADDPFYAAFVAIQDRAVSFPNGGLLSRRRALRAAITSALSPSPAP